MIEYETNSELSARVALAGSSFQSLLHLIPPSVPARSPSLKPVERAFSVHGASFGRFFRGVWPEAADTPQGGRNVPAPRTCKNWTFPVQGGPICPRRRRSTSKTRVLAPPKSISKFSSNRRRMRQVPSNPLMNGDGLDTSPVWRVQGFGRICEQTWFVGSGAYLAFQLPSILPRSSRSKNTSLEIRVFDAQLDIHPLGDPNLNLAANLPHSCQTGVAFLHSWRCPAKQPLVVRCCSACQRTRPDASSTHSGRSANRNQIQFVVITRTVSYDDLANSDDQDALLGHGLLTDRTKRVPATFGYHSIIEGRITNRHALAVTGQKSHRILVSAAQHVRDAGEPLPITRNQKHAYARRTGSHRSRDEKDP